MNPPSLRARQAEIARTSILEAFVRHLEAGDADDVAMEDLARDAGVSRRTLYRYFPSRDALLAAAGEWIRSEVLALPVEIGAEGIAASFLDAAGRLERRPRLARALLRTQAGRAARSGYREERVEAIRRAVRAEAPAASEAELERAAAVLSYLCSSGSWTAIQDDSGLDAAGAQAAVAWAIEALLARLRGEK
jgi:AcrR family transcriptional regulator